MRDRKALAFELKVSQINFCKQDHQDLRAVKASQPSQTYFLWSLLHLSIIPSEVPSSFVGGGWPFQELGNG